MDSSSVVFLRCPCRRLPLVAWQWCNIYITSGHMLHKEPILKQDCTCPMYQACLLYKTQFDCSVLGNSYVFNNIGLHSGLHIYAAFFSSGNVTVSDRKQFYASSSPEVNIYADSIPSRGSNKCLKVIQYRTTFKIAIVFQGEMVKTSLLLLNYSNTHLK